MSTDVSSIASYLAAFIFVLALIGVGAYLLKRMLAKSGKKAPSFLRGRERRLGVVEGASVDGRRKLVLIRRDDVEHLIMTGGPVDVVIETGIQASRPQMEQSDEPARDDDRVVIAHDEHRTAAGRNDQD